MTVTSGRLLAQRNFILLWCSRLTAMFAYQMLAVAIGWKIYEISNSALALGVVGLLQFVPTVLLTLLVGHAADRYDRRVIVRAAQAVYALAAGLLIVIFLSPAPRLELLFAAVFMIGCARAFELPTGHALVPSTVPGPLLSRAVGAWTSANQAAVISGPAAGGLIYAVSPVLVCAFAFILLVAAIAFITLMKIERSHSSREPATLKSMLAGIAYIRHRERLLGVTTLDLFVTLLGGVIALLPIYARDILLAGPATLGMLRSAPAVGALAMSVALVHLPIERRIGPKMFIVVAIYGAATVVFALSTSLPLSMVALATLGAADAMSVVIRFLLVQIETPDEMRGRVGAINSLFVGTSNTLGEFESGLVAAWLGAVPSALIGGIGSLLVAALWMMMFPSLRRIDRFEPADRSGSS
jgi:MFS family permease